MQDGGTRPAAPIAEVAISLGVTGKYGDIDGVWIEPVMAQLMMTLSDLFIVLLPPLRSLKNVRPAQIR